MLTSMAAWNDNWLQPYAVLKVVLRIRLWRARASHLLDTGFGAWDLRALS